MFIGVVCKDERMQQVADQLAKDYHVQFICNRADFLSCSNKIDVCILPIHGLMETDILLSDINKMKENVIVFSGLYDAELKNHFHQIYFYMQEEVVIQENAILTAEGILNEILSCSARSIYDLKVDIVGYGYCGKAIYEMLKHLQMEVRVIRRSCQQEGDFLPLAKWVQPNDIIIHTAVGEVLNKERMQRWRTYPIIFDIATPQVIDLDYAKQKGIQVKKMKNIPAKYASITAGNIIYRFIRGKLCEK